jgi:hypothetical protein
MLPGSKIPSAGAGRRRCGDVVDLQQPVDGLGLEAGRFGHAFGGASGRSAQQQLHPLRRLYAQNGFDDGVLPTPGPPVMTSTLDISASRIAATWLSYAPRPTAMPCRGHLQQRLSQAASALPPASRNAPVPVWRLRSDLSACNIIGARWTRVNPSVLTTSPPPARKSSAGQEGFPPSCQQSAKGATCCSRTKSSGERRPTSAFSDAPITLPTAFAGESAPVGLWSELGRSRWSLPEHTIRISSLCPF